MDEVKQLAAEFDSKRAANIDEWNSFSQQVKDDITAYNEKLNQHTLEKEEVDQKWTALKAKQDDYDRKHAELKTMLTEKNLDNDAAVKKIVEEQERLDKRRGEVTILQNKQSAEFERISEAKTKAMGEYEQFNSETMPELEAQKAKVEEMVGSLNTEQAAIGEFNTTLKGLQDKMAKLEGDEKRAAEVEMINTFNKAKEAQENLQKFHEEYLPEDAKYKVIVEKYNVGREKVRASMKMIDMEAGQFDSLQQIVSAQVKEINEQIQKLIAKQKNFTSAAAYIEGLQKELNEMGKEMNTTSGEMNVLIEKHNTEGQAINAEMEKINGQIGNSDLKMTFHKNKEADLVNEMKAKFEQLKIDTAKKAEELVKAGQ